MKRKLVSILFIVMIASGALCSCGETTVEQKAMNQKERIYAKLDSYKPEDFGGFFDEGQKKFDEAISKARKTVDNELAKNDPKKANEVEAFVNHLDVWIADIPNKAKIAKDEVESLQYKCKDEQQKKIVASYEDKLANAKNTKAFDKIVKEIKTKLDLK